MSWQIELENDCCNFYFERNGTDIWGSCLFTLSPDFDGGFEVETENITAWFDSEECELPCKLTFDEELNLADAIANEANNLMLWEKMLQERLDDLENEKIDEWKINRWN